MRTRIDALRQDLSGLSVIARSVPFCVAAGAWTIVAAFAIAIPTRLIPNAWFGRMTPVRPADYVFWAVASVLLGLAFALRRSVRSRSDVATVSGGVGTVLAVGCPICNKLVVALLGVSGALSVFGPLQPVLGAASIVVLVVALRRELRTIDLHACSVPSR